MPDIPQKHKDYGLLPLCQKYDHDCCIYDSKMLDDINSLLEEDDHVFPYGIKSIETYLEEVSEKEKMFEGNNYIIDLFEKYKKDILRLNDKTSWSVLRYIGSDALSNFTDGRCYYWVIASDGTFWGIIDNEEFTGYMHCTKACYWEIIDDPTGLAAEIMKQEIPNERNMFAGLSAEAVKKSMEAIGNQINNGVVLNSNNKREKRI